jgi:hypothetical protein
MMPHFKDCIIGSLDGTHILATPRPNDLIWYISRSGIATQNVLAIVDLDMRFTMHLWGSLGLCMTLMCSFMPLILIPTHFHNPLWVCRVIYLHFSHVYT